MSLKIDDDAGLGKEGNVGQCTDCKLVAGKH